MNKIRIILILFLILLILPQCSRSKKNFPWWLFLLNSSSNESDISSFNNLGGGSDGSSGGDNGGNLGGGSGGSSGGGGFIPANGIIDPTFGSNPDNGSNNDANEPNQYMMPSLTYFPFNKIEMAVQNDGKIIIVGHGCRNNCSSSDDVDLVVVRFDQDGTIDTSFGDNGVKIINVSQLEFSTNKKDLANSVTLDNEGYIYIAGVTQNASSKGLISVIKLDSSGNLVNAFDGNGIKTFDFSSSSNSEANVATKIIFYNNNLYVGGYYYVGRVPLDYDIFLFKMDTNNGSIDLSFNSGNGKYTFNSDNKTDKIYSFTIDASGNIYIPQVRRDSESDIAISISKLDNNGNLIDNSVLQWTTGFTARDIVMDNSGYIYLIGEKCRDIDGDGVCDGSGPAFYKYDFAVMKFKSDLTLDNNFGTHGDGIEFYQIGSNGSYAYSGAIQPDGKILLGGYIIKNSSPFDDFALIRIDSNGNLDNSFATNGIFQKDFYGRSDKCYTIKLLSSGKILMGGITQFNTSQNYNIIRIQ